MRIVQIICLSALLGGPTCAWAADADAIGATFRRGNDDYFHGRYREAIAAYEQIAAAGVRSEELYYNLGNAYLKAGELGLSVYNYERALNLDPGSEDARFNLKAAREAIKRKSDDRLVGAETVPLWIRTIEPLALGPLSWAFVLSYVGLFVLLGALHFVSPGFLQVGLRALLAFVGVGVIVSGVLLGGQLYLRKRIEQAIVLPDALPVKEGPDRNYQSSFVVHAGLRVRLIDREEDWARVRLGNGLEGWVQLGDLGRL